MFSVVAKDRSEPKLAVVVVKLDPVGVEVSVGVIWKVLVDIDDICAATVAAMLDVGVACNATAMELATEGE